MGWLDGLNLPTLADRKPAPQPKPTPRVIERIAAKRTRERKLQASKAEVWKRDNATCRLCGRRCQRTTQTVPSRGEVHHIRPRSLAPERFNDLSNLMLLCLLCHTKVTRHDVEVKP